METKQISEVGEMFKVADDEGNVELYEKCQQVDARPAVDGEVIVTIVKGEEETRNTAIEGDMVVRARTADKEQYIISGSKFESRYDGPNGEADEDGFSEYDPIGETYGFKYEGETFKFVAPWDEEMVCKDGDYICAPDKDDLSDIYRIEKGSFKETYKRVEVETA